MSRITKALEKLRVKCTEEGAHPNGNGTADILECIAEHYAGGGGAMVVKLTYDESTESFSCNHSIEEIANAFPNIIFVDAEDTVGYVCTFTDGRFVATLPAYGTAEDFHTSFFDGLNEFVIDESGVSYTHYEPDQD